MTLFNQSTKAVSAVVIEIADAAGASADTEMLTRAYRSLGAAVQHFNTRAKWNFNLTESDPVTIIAPFSVGTVTASAGQSSATAAAGHGVLVDDLISFAGLGAGVRVTATAAGSIGFNSTIDNAIGTGAVNVTANITRDCYSLPSAFKSIYSVRVHSNPKALYPLNRRVYDRSVYDQTTPTTPYFYDLFLFGGKGKIRLLPPPNAADFMQMRYHRRITMPSAVNDATLLDVPQDHELYLIAWAKWHFLTDKGDNERAQTWITLAEEGIKTILADQTTIPDEDLAFTPGATMVGATLTPNSPYYYDWNY